MSQRSKKSNDTHAWVGGVNVYAWVSAPARVADAPAVVLVHGVGVSGRYLLPTAEVLAHDHRVYVPDLPGFGRSDKPAHILSVPELADALAAWVRAAGPVRATYVANSLGCQTVVDFALRHTDLIERAVLVGPTVDTQARGMLRQIARGLLDMTREPLSYWPLLTRDYLTAGTVRTLVTLHHGVRDPLAEKLGRVPVPVLVVRGERDPIAPQRWVEEMCRLLPDGRHAVIAGAAHVANYTAPQELASLVRAFIQEAPPRPSGGAASGSEKSIAAVGTG